MQRGQKNCPQPHVVDQIWGVNSCCTAQYCLSFLATNLSPPPPITLEVARVQRSAAINARTPAIPEPEDGADLEPLPPPYDMLPPNEAAESSTQQSPEQIRAPTEVGGSLKPLRGKASRCTVGQMCLTSTHAFEGNIPIGRAHRRPPDLRDLQTQGSIILEGQSPSNPWPRSAHTRRGGLFLTRVPVCAPIRGTARASSSSIRMPIVGSELHAAQSAPQNSSSSFHLLHLTPSRARTRRERAPPPNGAPLTSALKPSKLPNPAERRPAGSRGRAISTGDSPVFLENIEPFGLARVAENADVGSRTLRH